MCAGAVPPLRGRGLLAINSARRENLDSLDAFIAYAFNRRFMVEVLANHSWVDACDKIPDFDGTQARLVTRM
jgi:hypothetical protein